jgi:hypothetical protein
MEGIFFKLFRENFNLDDPETFISESASIHPLKT